MSSIPYIFLRPRTSANHPNSLGKEPYLRSALTKLMNHRKDSQLTTEGSDRSGNLDAQILVGGQRTSLAVDITKHNRSDVDGKNVIRIGQETNTSDDTCASVEPTGKCHTASRLENDREECRGTHLNLALSISARAARRRSSRVKAGSLLGRSLWLDEEPELIVSLAMCTSSELPSRRWNTTGG